MTTNSEKLRETVLTLYWTYATALTTSIDGKTREWFTQTFDQACFNEAKQRYQGLILLERAPGIVTQHLDVQTVLSDEFERWLYKKPFQNGALLTGPIWPVLKVLCFNRDAETNQLCALLLQQRKNALANQHSSNAACLTKTYLDDCTSFVQKVVALTTKHYSSTVNAYRAWCTTAMLKFAGKKVRNVQKPEWQDLAASVSMTVIKLATGSQSRPKHEPQDAWCKCFKDALSAFERQQLETAKQAQE